MSGFERGHVDLRVVRCSATPASRPVLAGGAGAGAAAPPPQPLRPGDPIGVTLLGGDLEMGATGTVTHIDGDRVYAFGHPFFNLGPTAFPMTRATSTRSLPSLMSSFKIADAWARSIGTMQQDRATAIAGTLGKGPAVIPITVTLDSGRGGRRARSPTPSSTISSSRRS